jgi:hypothetical protein
MSVVVTGDESEGVAKMEAPSFSHNLKLFTSFKTISQ